MKILQSLTFLLGVGLLFGCGSPTASHKDLSNAYRIVLEDALNASRDVKLSEIADDLLFVELKTPGTVPIRAFQVQATKDYIFAPTRDGLLMFDLQGNYIRNIGSRGNGPGEYISATTFFIDEEKQTVEVSSVPRACLFSFEGKLLYETSLPMSIANLWMKDSLIYTAETPDGDKKHRLTIRNRSMDTIGSIPNYNRFKPWESDEISFMAMGGSKDGFYAYNRQAYFTGYADNDTIWRLDGRSYTPHAVMDMGKYKAPEPRSATDAANHFDRMEQEAGNYYSLGNIMEDARYIYFSASPYYNPKMEAPRILFDKKTKTSFAAKTADNKHGLSDDIMGGPPVWPRNMTSQMAVINWIEAETLLKQYENFPAPSLRLQEFMKGITEDSGTIIVLAKLRK